MRAKGAGAKPRSGEGDIKPGTVLKIDAESRLSRIEHCVSSLVSMLGNSARCGVLSYKERGRLLDLIYPGRAEMREGSGIRMTRDVTMGILNAICSEE